MLYLIALIKEDVDYAVLINQLSCNKCIKPNTQASIYKTAMHEKLIIR